MKTLLLTIGLTVVFLAIGAGVAFGIPGMSRGILTKPNEIAADSLNADPVDAVEDIAPLAEEMETIDDRLGRAEARADSLARLLDEQRSTYEESREEAADLAKTLAALEPAPLEEIVQRLDGRSFVQLYEASSSRNRGRLLNALSPAQAASFVRHQLPGGSARAPSRPSPRRPAADSSTATPAEPQP